MGKKPKPPKPPAPAAVAQPADVAVANKDEQEKLARLMGRDATKLSDPGVLAKVAADLNKPKRLLGKA